MRYAVRNGCVKGNVLGFAEQRNQAFSQNIGFNVFIISYLLEMSTCMGECFQDYS